MSLLHRWRELSGTERRLTFEAWCWLVVASVRLRLAPAGSNLEGLRRPGTTGHTSRGRLHPVDPPLVDAAVRRASRFVPGTRCLAKSLAAHAMLANAGAPSIHYAVTRSETPGGGLTAHAWVEMNGRRVAGDPAEDDAVTLAPRPTP